MKASNDTAPVPLADALRTAVLDSRLSYNELARRTGLDQGQISRYMAGQRDLTVAAASVLCLLLGYELAHTRPVLETLPPDAVPTTRRRRQAGLGLPADAAGRGQGRRMDLEGPPGEKPEAHKRRPPA